MKKFLQSDINSSKDPWYRFDRVIALLEAHAPIPSGATWLDLGCQLGQFLHRVLAEHDILATGIDDFEPGNVAEVCRKYFQIELGDPSQVFTASWRYLCRDIARGGFGVDEKFRYISALEILEHMVDTDAFLNECRRHLEPGGFLVVTTPNINSLRNRVMVPLGRYPAGMEYRNKIHHVRLYNADTLVSHLGEHGFRAIALAGVSFVPARALANPGVRAVDAVVASRVPSLCGNLIGLFQSTG